MTTKLTNADHEEFRRLEQIIERNKTSFESVCSALATIYQKQLWRIDGFESIEDYCLKRWGWGAARARQIIRADRTRRALPECLAKEITNERTARAISDVDPDRRKAVVQHLKSTSRPVNSVTVKEADTEVPRVHAAVMDETGFLVPVGVQEFWNRRNDVDRLVKTLINFKLELARIGESQDKLWYGINFQRAEASLNELISNLSEARPYAVCYLCGGHPEAQTGGRCRFCGGKGMVSRYRYDIMTPKEYKDIRAKAAK